MSYSCLFAFNTERRDIRIITGIVDTDQFKNHVSSFYDERI